jgi:predicted nucleic acid-binding protein
MNNSKKEQKEQAFNETRYADSNLFIYAATNTEGIGKKAKTILEKTKQGKIKLYTSALTIDEFLWRVKKEVGREDAANAAQIFFTFPNLELIDCTAIILQNSISSFKIDKLDPRDAIHLATMRQKNIKTIYSTEPDFDKIQNIKRIDFSK